MASAVVGVKRSFATMSDMNTAGASIAHDAGQEALVSHLRDIVSVDSSDSRNSSIESPPRGTPIPIPQYSTIRRSFEPDASILLIGMRGTGKSTLAVIASIACRRRVVDTDDLFHEATGFSTARYRKQFGAANHNLRQEELLQTALQMHDRDAIIVCNGGSLERNGQMLVQDFAKTHPVVHVVREIREIHDYLGAIDLQRLGDMLAYTAPILRHCSNYEFYNIAETRTVRNNDSTTTSVVPAFLTLKRAQRTFLKFLSLITSRSETGRLWASTIPILEPGYPLSDVATELRKHTCSVQVPISDLLADDVNIQNLELGSDAFEIVVDASQSSQYERTTKLDIADDISTCVSKVRRGTVVPIILHVLPQSSTIDGRLLYLRYVNYGLRTAPEFITFDLSWGEDALSEIIAARGVSKVIGHLHAERTWDDPSWLAHYDTAVRLGCALVRFSRTSESNDNDYFLQKLRFDTEARHDAIPLTCYNTGKAGRTSACFSSYLTPVIPASAKKSSVFPTKLQRNPQIPWVTAREVTQALYASFTFDPMQVYIIGASLGYSVSPAMHNAAYESCGMPHRFHRVQSSSLNSLKELVREANFGGSIVIQPYKVEVISLTDSLSQHARAIGAVNTLIPVRHLKADRSVPSELELFQERNQSGVVQALYGDNTEWIGIRSCVRRGLSPANAVRPTSCGLVIGAGGMARAAVYALLQLGVKNIVIFNRTVDKAEKLVAHFTRLASSTGFTRTPSAKLQSCKQDFHILKTRDDEWPKAFRQPTIILSCIPADPIDGGPAAQFTLPPLWMQSPTGGVVMEIAYKTLNTPLMQQVNLDPKFTYMDGLDFLPEQAFAQFELFTGKRAPRRVMREEVLRAWRDEQGNADLDMVERRLKAIDDQEP
ncbi:type I 3-dehydroquinase-domain-containing protein [Phaeosphaeria sp. MPI-PUGE-AT-0046c]|nr:type I 3-dehydroquinase-domain-containing protein [Phaeosphaeria sp. MPI-PUGE-AT-0046c]